VPCQVFAGDVVRLQILGNNGVVKPRFSVVVELLPGISRPEAVLVIFGCSETKRGAVDDRYHRVEFEDRAATNMGLLNSTTFHIEDTRGFDALSPQLKKIGKCPYKAFLPLKALVEARLAEDEPIQVLPDRASEPARAAVAAAQAAHKPAPEPESEPAK